MILNGSANADPNASDPSGIASASCDPVDTTTAGTHTLTCTATDTAGNTATASVSYDVTYAVALRYDPQRPTRYGINVELALSLTDANGNNVSSRSIRVTAVALRDANGRTVQTLNTHFKYVKKNQSYIIKLKAKGLDKGTYQLEFRVAGDPVAHLAPFRLR
ncbi:MAG TPA: hypothetical protein VFV93_11470 [Thermomicrobiales bacterium]|nr:hypothetical protein [Thermomicrobiales bacterium]